MKPNRKGFTLLELIVSMGILSGLLVLIFAAFELGTRIFRETSVRQSSENQMRGIKLLLERDAKLTNFWYCNSYSRTSTDGMRDGLCLAGLSDWNDAANYNATTGRPKWNRYVVWYATEGPAGSLYRQLIDPNAPADGFSTAYQNLSGNLNPDPDTNSNVVYSRVLSNNVLDFAAALRLQNGTISVTVRLKAQGQKRPFSGVKVEDNLQVQMTFQPKNSWPAI